MKKKIFISLVMIAVLSVTVFCLSSELKTFILCSDTETEVSEERKEGAMSENRQRVNIQVNKMSQEINNNSVVRIKAKKGEHEGSELGLYWQRDEIQRVFYPDIQEICEASFGDYLSPLQGLYDIIYDMGNRCGKRYRTDKESAVVEQGSAEFYLFLQNVVALVTIKDTGENYYTSFRILSEKESGEIRILEIPQPGGIGVAGISHRPEKQNYATHSLITNEDQQEYTKADIQLVFNNDLQAITEDVFGNYVQSLQGLYMLLEQEGYGSSDLFLVESVARYRLYPEDLETVVIKDNLCEFTLILNSQDRVRVSIAKKENQYITTIRLLKIGELETEVQAG